MLVQPNGTDLRAQTGAPLDFVGPQPATLRRPLLRYTQSSVRYPYRSASIRRWLDMPASTPQPALEAVGFEEHNMSERVGLLFSDGSILVLPEGADSEAANEEAAEHAVGDAGVRPQAVRLTIELFKARRDCW
jgi:hypothetical protein